MNAILRAAVFASGSALAVFVIAPAIAGPMTSDSDVALFIGLVGGWICALPSSR